ncbi:retrovirus-related pol polyprotein from transposon TNT 1-94 [Tanacetum coccineum]
MKFCLIITKDGENLDKMKEKGDPCVMVGYSTQSKGYRVYNKRTRLIVESIHIKFDEIKEMMSDHNSSDLAPQRQERFFLSVEMLLQASFLKDKKASDFYDNLTPLSQVNLFLQQRRQIRHIKGWNFSSVLYLKNITIQHTVMLRTTTMIKHRMHHFKKLNLSILFVHGYKKLKQVRKIPTMPVQTRRQLATDPEMCMFLPLSPEGFVDPDHPEKVYLLRKALYGLKQAPRAWYDELSNFLMSKGFTKGTIDPTLFKIKYGEDILLVQIYVDDIIFGSTNPKYSKRFEKLMHSRFEMSLMGEMKFFLGLQIHQSPKARGEYVGSLSASCASSNVDEDTDKDYGFNYNNIPLYCDSQSAIAISCNPVQHSRTNHIHTRYHFIKEQVENGRIGMRCLTPADLEVLQMRLLVSSSNITMVANLSSSELLKQKNALIESRARDQSNSLQDIPLPNIMNIIKFTAVNRVSAHINVIFAQNHPDSEYYICITCRFGNPA